MFAVLSTTSTLFITIFLGLLCGMLGLFKSGDDRILINYVFYVALPLYLFLSCYHASWHIFNIPYLLSYCVSMALIIIATYCLSRRYFFASQSGSVIHTLSVSQVDGAYFTVALFSIVFHDSSLAVPLMLLQNVIFLTLSLFFLEVSVEATAKNHNGLKFAMTHIYHVLSRNPIIVASLLGLLCASLSYKLPSELLHSAEFLGNTSSAVALFSLGLTCAFSLQHLADHRQLIQLCVLSFLKLFIFPLIAVGVGMLFALPQSLLVALVLLTASPAATHTYIIAAKYHCDPQIATFNVVFTTLFSFLTINLWLYYFH